MNCPEPPYEVSAVDADDLAFRKQFSEHIQRVPVIGIVESRNQNDIVCDIEVRVAGRQPLIPEDHRGRHG